MAFGRSTSASIVACVASLLFACAGGSERAPDHAQKGEDAPRRNAKDDKNTEADDTETPPPPAEPPAPDERVTPPGPGHLDPKLLPSEPEGAIDITPRSPNRCIAQLELTAELIGKEVTIRATLASNSDNSVRVTLRSPCPGGPVSFSGREKGYEYNGTCNAGACREADKPLTVSLPAGRRKVEIASTSFSLSGDACLPEFSPGTHEVYGHAEVLSPKGATICGSAFTTFTVPETEKKRAPPARAPCPPQPICGLACPSGRFARDENGCSLCACAETFPGGF